MVDAAQFAKHVARLLEQAALPLATYGLHTWATPGPHRPNTNMKYSPPNSLDAAAAEAQHMAEQARLTGAVYDSVMHLRQQCTPAQLKEMAQRAQRSNKSRYFLGLLAIALAGGTVGTSHPSPPIQHTKAGTVTIEAGTNLHPRSYQTAATTSWNTEFSPRSFTVQPDHYMHSQIIQNTKQKDFLNNTTLTVTELPWWGDTARYVVTVNGEEGKGKRVAEFFPADVEEGVKQGTVMNKVHTNLYHMFNKRRDESRW